jgi:hypothetical protein
MYPAYKFVFEIGHPFVRAFALGDLLLFSGLLLMEAAEEAKTIGKPDAVDWSEWIRAGAVFVLIAFSLLRHDALNKELKLLSGSEGVEAKLQLYALANLIIAVACVMFMVRLFWASEETEAERALAYYARTGRIYK